MTNSCRETVNSIPHEGTVVDEVPILKPSHSSESLTTTTVEESEEPPVTMAANEDDSSECSSELDLDFGVMGVSEGLPQEEESGVMGMVAAPFALVPTASAAAEGEVEEEVMPMGGFIMGASAALPQGTTTCILAEPTATTTIPLAEPGLVTVETIKKQLQEEASAEATVEGVTAVTGEQQAVTTEELTTETAKGTATPEGEPLQPPLQEDATMLPEVTKPQKPLTFADTLRKGAVAVAGGTLTAVGLVMIPLPTPCGALVAGSGMALLGTEFEAANRVMENLHTKAATVRDQMIDNIEKSIQDEGCQKDVDEIVIAKLPSDAINVTIDENATTNNNNNKQGETTGKVVEGQRTDTDTATIHLDSPDDNSNNTETNANTTNNDSEFVIAVNADPYFNKEEQDIVDQRNKGGFVNNYVYNPLQRTRQRIGIEKKGWLATSVLPMLKSTKTMTASKDNHQKL